MDIEKMVREAPLTISDDECDELVSFADMVRSASLKADAIRPPCRATISIDPIICPALYIVLRAGIRAVNEGLVALDEPS